MRYSIGLLFICTLWMYSAHVEAGPLHDAARKGDLAAVKSLLEQGTKVDEADGEDKTALYHAAAYNHPEIVQLLIERGAGVNRIRKDFQGPVDGAIHVAAKRGYVRVIEILAAGGANLTTATIHTEAPLHLALRYKKTEAANLLRSLGAANFRAPSVNSLIPNANLELGRKLVVGCGNCHAVQKEGKPSGGYGSEFGPTLWDIVGREKGGVAGWEYSAALSNSEGNWTYEELNNFLANPTASIPGTKMWFFVKDNEARAAIIAYLRTLSDNPASMP